MRRDPTEFRQRFAAWKDGENYWDTRGEDMLPGYSGGKTKKDSAYVSPQAQQAVRYFMSKGLTDFQAAGLVGNLMRESGMNHRSKNSGSGAYGLAQWLGSRKKALFNKYGNNPSFQNQLDFIWHELNTSHKSGLKYLRRSKTAEEAARNAMGYYEFSAGPEGAIAEMNKYGQDGRKSMREGITNATRLIGQPIPSRGPLKPTLISTQPVVERLKENELPLQLPNQQPIVQMEPQPANTLQQTQNILAQNDYWDGFFNNSSLDQLQSLMQQQMTSHKHGKNILPRHKDGKTPGEYDEELVELPEVRVDDEGNVVQDGRRGSIRLPEVVVNRTDPRNYRSAFNGNQGYLDDIVGFVPVAGDVNDAINAGIAANKGDYLQAGILGAGLLLPNVLEKPLKLVAKVGKRGFKNVANAVGVQDYVWDDLEDAGIKKILKAKLSGEYAFTKKGHDKLARSLWRKKISPIAQDVIDTSIALEDIQFKKRMYGKYSDRLDDYPRYIGLPDSDTISPVEYDFKKNLIYDQLGDRKPKYFVQTDPRQIRRAPDIRGQLEDVYTSLLTDLPLADRSFSGIYHPDVKRIDIPMHVKAHTGFLNPYLTGDEKGLRFLIGHEYTHHLQNQPNFAQNLALSVFSGKNDNYWTAMPGDYVFGKYQNPFQQVYNRANNRLNEVTASKKLGFGQQVDPELEFGENGYTKYGSHNASPDEAVADLRGFIIAGYSDDEIYRRMAKEYGMTADDVDLAIEMGYKHGKNPIHINPANRGKFNALKKRTGKTTEQLTHSKNPLTRKRAIFSQNAAKWRRK